MTSTPLRSLAALAARVLGRRPLPTVGQTPHDVIFAENKWRLLRYRSPGLRHETPILIVPSLINRHYVLDLLPGKSLIEYLVEAGHDVHVVDWGTPGDEDRLLSFDDICDRYLGHALHVTGRAHLLGYCLGGTLAAIHAAAHPERVASLCALAAPIRFHDDGLLAAWTRSPGFQPATLVDALGNVPWPLMQASFHLLRPTLTLSKLVHVLDRAWNDEFLDGFLALETWGNDNVSFPGACWRQYVEQLYRDDALADGRFRLGGRSAHLAMIDAPVLAVTFEHDGIVPWRGAACLLDLVSSEVKEHLHLPGGHVGAVVSRAASKGLWPRIEGFFAKHG
jgi:polyhydroxyalkanoate synthase